MPTPMRSLGTSVTESIAHELVVSVRHAGLGARPTCRPWNYRYPGDTTWWIVPTTTWPAYKHGKFVVCSSAGSGSQVRLGFNVERGVGDVAKGLVKAAEVMGPTWRWAGFVEDIARPEFAHAMESIRRSGVGVPCLRVVAAQYGGEGGLKGPRDTYAMELAGAAGSFRVEKSEIPAKILPPLADSVSFGALSQALGGIAQPWAWIDLHLYVSFGVAPSAASPLTSLHSAFEAALLPLARWFK